MFCHTYLSVSKRPGCLCTLSELSLSRGHTTEVETIAKNGKVGIVVVVVVVADGRGWDVSLAYLQSVACSC